MSANKDIELWVAKAKSYVMQIFIVAAAMMCTMGISKGLLDQLKKLAHQRTSNDFVIESIVLCCFLFVTGSLVDRLTRKNNGNERTLKIRLANSILDEVPRVAYLLGTVSSATIVCLAGVSLFWDTEQGIGFYPLPIVAGYVFSAIFMAFIFGAFGALLEDLIRQPIIELAKVFMWVIATLLLSMLLPLMAPLFFVILYKAYAPVNNAMKHCELCGKVID